MKLVLVRHAQTSANIDMVWHGHTDTSLTQEWFIAEKSCREGKQAKLNVVFQDKTSWMIPGVRNKGLPSLNYNLHELLAATYYFK